MPPPSVALPSLPNLPTEITPALDPPSFEPPAFPPTPSSSSSVPSSLPSLPALPVRQDPPATIPNAQSSDGPAESSRSLPTAPALPPLTVPTTSGLPTAPTSSAVPSPGLPVPGANGLSSNANDAMQPSEQRSFSSELKSEKDSATDNRFAEKRGGAWSMVTPTPGARQFDGSQNPSLEIHKRAPSEVQVGVPATFTAVVRNIGSATAFDVQVTDAIPKGARLVRTFPEAQRVGNDGLSWSLGEIAAGQETTISMELVPEKEGELGSVASVKFAAQASVRTISTLPKLVIKQSAASELLGGDSTTILIDVTNAGTGMARDVRLEEDVPAIFRHKTGATALQQDVGDLPPGETLRFEIELTALTPGKASNIVRATSSNSVTAESSVPMEVKAPKLQVRLVGPKLRYLERPAPYEAVIENVGTAAARDLYITARLPRGMNFVSASNEGTYLPDQHAVAWNLLELAPGTRAKTELVLLPIEEGKFSILLSTEGEGVRAEPADREVMVEGQSELTFEIDDDNDPIEVAGITTYAVKLQNIGTRPDADVRLVVEVPEGATVEQVSSPMKYQVAGRQVVFSPIESLGSKSQVIAKVSVRHSREGTQVLRAALQSKLRPVAVIKEESTQVYRDQ